MKPVLLFIFLFAINFHPQRIYKGCFAISNGAEPKNYGRSGNLEIDRITTQEIFFIQQRFLVAPIFFFYDDANGKNAFATEKVYQQNGPDGTVFLGRRLFNSEFIRSPGGTSIPIIIAHEYAHIVDFKYGVLNEPGIRRELFADYLAGAYMSLRNRFFKQTNIYACVQSFEDMGGTDFSNPDFHGTSEQRGNALLAGYNEMEAHVSTGTPFLLTDINKAAKAYILKIKIPKDFSAKDPE
ncbi:MAG: DUF2800 domain-containing protein [Bacteroidota bacterium]|nr:DUF2800 domain-containing protein [Bacteroidota bacterium]